MNACFATDDTSGYDVFEERNLTGTSERNLLMAILERAIIDYVGNSRKEANDAEEWMFGEGSDSLYIDFSFAWVCHQLDLDPQHIAKLVLAMPKRGENRLAPWYFMKEAS